MKIPYLEKKKKNFKDLIVLKKKKGKKKHKGNEFNQKLAIHRKYLENFFISF
jgi:hypothetical protein